jgi:hypothetical protein
MIDPSGPSASGPPSFVSVYVCWCTVQGREGAAALFDRLKVGSVVALKGRVQQHPQPPAAASSVDSNGSNGSTEHHQQVLDLVVQEIRVLHKNRWVDDHLSSGLCLEVCRVWCSWLVLQLGPVRSEANLTGFGSNKAWHPKHSSTEAAACKPCHVDMCASCIIAGGGLSADQLPVMPSRSVVAEQDVSPWGGDV